MALLIEPDRRVEGPAVDVFRVIFETTFDVLRLTLPESEADAIAHQHLRHIHEALADAGFIVRDYINET
jgi:hypothetical protein